MPEEMTVAAIERWKRDARARAAVAAGPREAWHVQGWTKAIPPGRRRASNLNCGGVFSTLALAQEYARARGAAEGTISLVIDPTPEEVDWMIHFGIFVPAGAGGGGA
jgi:hypothetical protein